MLRLSKKADYALIAMKHLALRGDRASSSAREIAVADVIQAIDGPVTVTACSTDDAQCEQYSKCNVRDPLWRVRERILTALGECTVAELASDPPQRVPPRSAVLH